MTYKKLKEIIEKNHIPEDVHLMSNSGWECGATEMDGVYYSPSANEIHFTQSSEYRSANDYAGEDVGSKAGSHRTDWILLKY